MPYNLTDLIHELGQAGRQVTELGAAEGSAGNLSIFVRKLSALPKKWRSYGIQPLPAEAASLAEGWLIVTGTGRRLRDVLPAPQRSLCLLHILPGGEQAERFGLQDVRPTSELNSHLAIHADQAASAGGTLDFHAVVHAQPVYITFLSHIERYADPLEFNRRLLRWEPETILVFPQGLGLALFQVPGSPEQMRVTVEALRRHRLVVWQRHGVVTRSAQSILQAADLVEYAETAAHYEYLNLQAGEPSQGLDSAELRRICQAYGVSSELLG